MRCQICNKKARENKVICSDHCQEVRLMTHKLVDKYFPTKGCENCWGDLGGRCSEQCQKEFREMGKFATDLWALVHLTSHRVKE